MVYDAVFWFSVFVLFRTINFSSWIPANESISITKPKTCSNTKRFMEWYLWITSDAHVHRKSLEKHEDQWARPTMVACPWWWTADSVTHHHARIQSATMQTIQIFKYDWTFRLPHSPILNNEPNCWYWKMISYILTESFCSITSLIIRTLTRCMPSFCFYLFIYIPCYMLYII